MSWTKDPFWVHKTSLLRRGLPTMQAARYCFVNWHQNEQEEEGDTLVHTFIKEPWLHCETRWFTFRAKVDLEWLPSVGPIFEKHRVAPALPVLKQAHQTPLEGAAGCTRDCQNAQSFTPQQDFALILLSLPLRRRSVDADGIWHIQLRTNDGNHPSEEVLWETTMDVEVMPIYPDWQWFTFPVSSVPLLTDVPYWIVTFRTDYTYYWLYPHIMGDTGDLYPRGEYLMRSTPVGSWTGHGQRFDHGFRTWK